MKAKIVLVALLLVVVGGYTAFWYVTAQKIENAFIAEIESQRHAVITYDRIEKRGFPFFIQLAFINPKVLVVNEGISLDLIGSLGFRWLPFGKLQDIDMSGKSRFTIPHGDVDHPSEMYFEGNTVAEIDSIETIADKGVFKISQGRIRSNELGIGEFDCLFDLITLAYDIKHPDPDRSVFDFSVDLKGGVFKNLEYFSGETKTSTQSVFTDIYRTIAHTVVEKSGKTNSSFVFSCDVPSMQKVNQLIKTPFLLLTQPIPNVSIALKRGATSNDVTTGDVIGSLQIIEDKKHNIVVDCSCQGFLKYLAGYHDVLVATVDKVAELAANWDAPPDLLLAKNFLINDTAIIKSLMPYPETLGKIEASQNSLLVLNKRTAFWHLTVNTLDLSCDQYGISAKANAQDRYQTLHADIEITLKNAPKLIEDVVRFYNKIEGFVNLFQPDIKKHLKPLPPGATRKIVNFLISLSRNPENASQDSSNDLDITVTYNNGNIKIGPLTREEARAEAEAIWTDIMADGPV